MSLLDNPGGGGLGLPRIGAKIINLSSSNTNTKYYHTDLAKKNINRLSDFCDSKNRIPTSTFSTETPTYVVLYHILHGRTLSCTFFTVVISVRYGSSFLSQSFPTMSHIIRL